MAVWQDFAEMAYGEARIDTAVHWLTPQQVMTWLSEARHKYQLATNKLKLHHAIALDPNSTDGSYAFPVDYRENGTVSATYAPVGAQDFVPVERCGYERYQRIVHTDASILRSVSIMQMPQQGAALILAEAYEKFWVYPFKGATGTITIRYTPRCTPYSPTDSVNWSAYGADPETAMATLGPEPEFQDAYEGFKNYLLYKILMKKPGRTSADEAQAQDAMMNFLMAEKALRRTNVDYANSEPAPSYLGPVK